MVRLSEQLSKAKHRKRERLRQREQRQERVAAVLSTFTANAPVGGSAVDDGVADATTEPVIGSSAELLARLAGTVRGVADAPVAPPDVLDLSTPRESVADDDPDADDPAQVFAAGPSALDSWRASAPDVQPSASVSASTSQLAAPALAPPPISATRGHITLMIELPTELVAAYSASAASANQPLTAHIAERLRYCAPFTSSTGLYVDDTSRLRMSRALGSGLTSSAELVNAVLALVTVRLRSHAIPQIPIDVELDRELAEVISMGAIGGFTFEDRVRQFAMQGLRQARGY
jgi:hypothetical protein